MKKHFTSTIFVIYKSKIALHWHNKVEEWLPAGGHIDDNETPIEAGLREVKEETGITDLKIIDFRTITYHLFKKNSEYCLKETSWYNMVSNFDGKFTPEIKEDITKVVWKNENKIRKIKNTFPNIKLLLNI